MLLFAALDSGDHSLLGTDLGIMHEKHVQLLLDTFVLFYLFVFNGGKTG